MARKISARRDGFRDERMQQNNPRKRSQDYPRTKKGYTKSVRYERNNFEKRQRPINRISQSDISARSRRGEYQDFPRQERVRNRRPTQERKVNDRYNASTQQQLNKSPGLIFFSFVSNLVFYGLTIGIISMAIMFSFSSKSTASIFGYRFYTVLTNSMVPQENGPKGGFYAGDIVILKLMDSSKLEKDDIVTFTVGDGSRYLTHRMVERKDELNGEAGDYIITKGDANKSNDPPIKADRVLGKVVFSIPKVGNIIEFVREEFWACLVCTLSLYGFFLVLRAYLFSPKEKYESGKRRSRQPVY